MPYKNEQHRRTALRNLAKGTFEGFKIRCHQLYDCDGLWDIEKRQLKKVEMELNWILHKWTKYPPKGKENV